MVRMSTLSMTMHGNSSVEDTEEEDEEDTRRYRTQVSRSSRASTKSHRRQRSNDYGNGRLFRTLSRRSSRAHKRQRSSDYDHEEVSLPRIAEKRHLERLNNGWKVIRDTRERQVEAGEGPSSQDVRSDRERTEERRQLAAESYSAEGRNTALDEASSRRKHRREKHEGGNERLDKSHRRRKLKDTNVVAERERDSSVEVHLGKERPSRQSRPDTTKHVSSEPRSKRRLKRAPASQEDGISQEDFERLQMYLQVFRSRGKFPRQEDTGVEPVRESARQWREHDQEGNPQPFRYNRYEADCRRTKKNRVFPEPIYDRLDRSQTLAQMPRSLPPPVPPQRMADTVSTSFPAMPFQETTNNVESNPVSGAKVQAEDGDSEEETCQQDLVKFMEKSSLPSLRVIGDISSRGLRRVFWILILAAGLGVAAFILVNQILKLGDHRTLVTTTDEMLPSIALPAITICNNNMFRKSGMSGTNGTDTKLLKRLMMFAESKYTRQNVTSGISSGRYTERKLKEEIYEGAHQLQNMLSTCTLGGAVLNCGEVFSRQLTEMGVCYTLNSDDYVTRFGAKSVIDGGRVGAFDVILGIEREEYAGFASGGVTVSIHDSGSLPQIKHYGVSFSPGNDVFLSLRKEEYTRLPSPYGSCEDVKAEGYKNKLQFHSTYSWSACTAECRVTALSERCSCRLFYDRGDARICVNHEDMICAKSLLDTFSPVQNCTCQRSCNTTQYITRWSSSSFPSQRLAASMMSQFNKSEEEIRRNFLRLSVYHEDMMVRKISERPVYDAYDFIGDLGGILCFFLGLSLATFFELCELIFGSTARGCCCRKKKRKSSKITESFA